VAAVKEALKSLPCVEPDSVNVNYDAKEASFTVKEGAKCDMEAVKKAVADTGRGTVGEVKAAPK
jgi:copper chaperone CopZ